MNSDTAKVAAETAPKELNDHRITGDFNAKGVRFEKRPAKLPDGTVAEGLYNAWIILDNPTQFNSYTTEMAKGVTLAFNQASLSRDVVAVVFTGVGDHAL